MSKIDGKTRICGIFGCPVGHSFSPAMHNAAYNYLGINWVYIPFQVEPVNLPAAVAGIRALGMAGVNITVPHKQEALRLVDSLTPAARIIGAVNTIVNSQGVLTGDNTDGEGFIRALEEETGFLPKDGTALILGAGGAARAVSVALALNNAPEVIISNRTLDKAVAIVDLIKGNTEAKASAISWPESGKIGSNVGTEWEQVLERTSLIVQTTSLGMGEKKDYPFPFPYHLLSSKHTVVDLVYNPSVTGFMEGCISYGAKVCNGLGMLLYQGALSFELWTKEDAPLEVMKKTLDSEIIKAKFL
ncbi:MAG: shikimate dehydrogenase [Peptococcaceae bacterium]|nr:shikimate dehydrogenase [Peptococcaceae bacterium]